MGPMTTVGRDSRDNGNIFEEGKESKSQDGTSKDKKPPKAPKSDVIADGGQLE